MSSDFTRKADRYNRHTINWLHAGRMRQSDLDGRYWTRGLSFGLLLWDSGGSGTLSTTALLRSFPVEGLVRVQGRMVLTLAAVGATAQSAEVLAVTDVMTRKKAAIAVLRFSCGLVSLLDA